MFLIRSSPSRLVLSVLLAAFCGSAPGCGNDPTNELASEDARPATLEDWQAERARVDATVWADERLAANYERSLVTLWDALLAARDRPVDASVAVFSSLEFESLRIGAKTPPTALDHGIERFDFGAPFEELDPKAWRALLDSLAAGGLRLVQSEWHHARFSPARDGQPARSQVAIGLHLLDSGDERRIVLEGPLEVEWSSERDASGNPRPRTIDASGLQLLVRSGPPAFQQILNQAWSSPGGLSRIHPVLVYDLDRDGLSDIVAVGAASVLRNRGGGKFEDAPLMAHPYLLTESGAIGDLTGDGQPDLISTRGRGDLVIYAGDAKGYFPDEPIVTPRFGEPLRAPSSIALGDVDADGDLDVWLAQYKPAYDGGQMPTPYYDANDGHPSYLLLNQGDGTLLPATEAAGLAAKRFRRSYTSSLIDLDEDGDLDLLVVSDYAGVDFYRNDGSGHFSDANDALHGDRHLFGMSASFGDFDGDGRLDFFVAGMASTTARRLEALGLHRDDLTDDMRMRMAWGNRMFLARNGGFAEPEFSAQVARTGWTWGTTAFDFDNDGDRDLFAANGHQSGESTRDYCANFWTHDIYEGRSEPDPALASLFADASRDLAAGAMSWDGYQKNHLLMNLGGKGFVNVAFLLGVADEFDSRSALSEDLDLDGRVDLIVVEGDGGGDQRLHVYRNQLETDGGWIGVRLVEEGLGVSPVGASVRVITPEQVHVGRIVTGETLMGQHSTTLHFGLGASERVDAIEVRWVDGRTRVIEHPEIGQYHAVKAPPRASSDAASQGG